MKQTGSTKIGKRRLISRLEKESGATKQAIFRAVARQLSAPRRIQPKVNLMKLSGLAKRFSKAVFVVPGKVLGTGDAEGALVVAAYSFSEGAVKKIRAAKGTAMTLNQWLDSKGAVKNAMIVK